MEIKERLKILRKERALSKKELVDKIKINYSTYANYESGTREPGSEMLRILSDFYDVSIDYILGITDLKQKTDNSIEFTPAEQTHIKKYRALDERGKQTVDSILDIEHSRITPAKAEIDQAKKEDSAVNDRRLTRAQAHQLLDEQIDAQEKGKMSSVSIITNGLRKGNAG